MILSIDWYVPEEAPVNVEDAAVMMGSLNFLNFKLKWILDKKLKLNIHVIIALIFFSYKGTYCQDNVYAAGICERLKPCVLCKEFGKDLPQCRDCRITVETVNELGKKSTCFNSILISHRKESLI